MIKIIYKEKIYTSDDNGYISFDGNKIMYSKYENYRDEIILVNIESYDSIKFVSDDYSITLSKERISDIVVDGDCFDISWDKDKFIDGNGNGKNTIETEYINGTLEII